MKLEKLNYILTGFVSNVLGTLAMFLVTIFLTNSVDQQIYGEFRLVFSFISIAVIILMLGRDSGLLYYTQNVENNLVNNIISEEAFNTLLTFIFGTFVLFIFNSFIISYVFNNSVNDVNYFISLIMIPLWGFFNFCVAGLRSKLFINYSFILTNFFQRLLRVPFFILFVYIDKSFFSLAMSMIISQCLLILIVIKKIPHVINFIKINKFSFFKRLSYSLQLGIGSIIYVILSRIDILMIGNIMSVEDVAIYDICVLLSFVVWFPYSALVKSSEPIIKSIINNRELLKKYNFDLKIAIIISSIIVLIFSLFTTLILSIFGENYNFGKETLIILSFGYLIINFFASPIEFLNMSGYVKISVVILILSLIINIVLNYILINTIGLEGASISTITSLIFSKTIALKYVKKKMNMNLIDFSNIYKLIPLFIFISIYLMTKNYLSLFSSLNVFFIKIIAFISFIIISYLLNKDDVKLVFNNK